MELLERAFEKIGARVKFGEPGPAWANGRRIVQNLALDVRTDAKGEFFFIARNRDAVEELIALDVQPREKHLLLLSREKGEKHRFLLGHDERHWFVAGIPEANPVSRVRDAKLALKPEAVVLSEFCVRRKERDRRRNAARIRQGEWFFVPVHHAPIDSLLILRNEPLVRSRGGKPHMCEELYRFGGETVYVSPGFPNGLTDAEYRGFSDAERGRWSWRVMRRNPKVYVRGRVRHTDHATVTLNGWHEVLSNTEHLSKAMRDVVFLD
ncbi:MAG TPA: hypothetical protein VE377_11390 [Candidatus Dormibacteraeota bacterium]|nr:hypothetical protein [Candidatus Dormibacteraeota bacterium]